MCNTTYAPREVLGCCIQSSVGIRELNLLEAQGTFYMKLKLLAHKKLEL